MGDAAAGDSLVRGFDYRLRPWEPADRDEVIALIIGIQRGEFSLPITASDQPDLADIARFYRAGGGEFWVAIYGGSVVGTIAALKIGEDVAALRKMFVAREHRGGSGLAASLMQTLVGWAEERASRRSSSAPPQQWAPRTASMRDTDSCPSTQGSCPPVSREWR
jgi:GNAT superfamily N-acetyltransferase